MTDITQHEQQVLGAMLTSKAAVDDVQRIITGDQFRDARHELIFDAITAQADGNQPTDVVAVADRLGDDLTKCGGHLYLHELVNGLVSAASAEWNAGKVKDAHTVRKVRELGAALTALADVDADALEVLDQARSTLDGLAISDAGEQTNEDAVIDALAALEKEHGIPTPWEDLSNAINGWAPGMLYVIGARPGVGKSVAAVEILLDVAKRDASALMVSLEMPKVELYHRMLSNVGKVDGERIQHRVLTEADRDKLSSAANKIMRLPIQVDDRSNMSIAQIRAKARTMQRNGSLGVIIVDYLGLVRPPRDAPRNDRRVQVDAIAQGLKDMSRDLGVPVVALTQLNREIEARAVKAPTLADLRESGGIEAAADVVILLHRDKRDTPNRLEVSVEKNRHGPQSWFHLNFTGAYSAITQPAWNPTGAIA